MKKVFFVDKSGATVIVFALVLIPIMIVAAFSIDSSRQVTARHHLQVSLDAAALAGARVMEDAGNTKAQIRQTVFNSFRANLETMHGDQECEDPKIAIDNREGTVKIDADCIIPSIFGRAFWASDLPVSNSATARAAIVKIDVAFALDTSSSMQGQRLADLKRATKEAAANLITPRTQGRVRLAFNAYNATVDSGIYAPQVFQLYVPIFTSTCVKERLGGNAFTDARPGPGRWIGQWFPPLPGMPPPKPNDQPPDCSKSKLFPLSSNLNSFNQAIDSLETGTGTAGHIGIAWSWYLLSPKWRGIWPRISTPLNYDERNSLKVVILMTDGRFVRKKPRFEASDPNMHARRLCSAMRAKDIIVFSVVFQTASTSKDVLKDCAGEDDRFFEARNGDQLLDAYREIAAQLSSLAIID